jgi:hypothetical protein
MILEQLKAAVEQGKTITLIHNGKRYRWRINGKLKVWKRTYANDGQLKFQLPIKHGLYDYGYINNDNVNQFIIE